MSASIRLVALPAIPEVGTGDDLAGLILQGIKAAGLTPEAGDLLAVAQKVVSKQENRFVDLASVKPSRRALRYAERCHKEPAVVELILREATRVVRCVPGVLIVRHRLGYVVANAGIDQSNVPDGDRQVLLLPQDPDASADRLRQDLRSRTGVDMAVLINDSFGRAWRQGVCGACIGASGLAALIDERGRADRFGRTMRATLIGAGDELAAAASLVMGQTDEGTPAVLIRGLAKRFFAEVPAAALVRPPAEDLF